MPIKWEPYEAQNAEWPQTGRHILAQYDDESVVVYQAYAPAIGTFASENGYFGANWSRTRMSWIKPNFLWMMFRCGWATKENQETVLALTLRRAAFEQILSEAVGSSYDAASWKSEADWKAALSHSSVRLQWDPDHGPTGEKLERRAIQLGLRGNVLESFGREWLLEVQDITPLVREQHAHVLARRFDELKTPRERVFPVSPEIAQTLGMNAEGKMNQ